MKTSNKTEIEENKDKEFDYIQTKETKQFIHKCGSQSINIHNVTEISKPYKKTGKLDDGTTYEVWKITIKYRDFDGKEHNIEINAFLED